MIAPLTEREIACFMIGFSDSVGCHLKTEHPEYQFKKIDSGLQFQTVRDLQSVGIFVTSEFYSHVLAESQKLMKSKGGLLSHPIKFWDCKGDMVKA